MPQNVCAMSTPNHGSREEIKCGHGVDFDVYTLPVFSYQHKEATTKEPIMGANWQTLKGVKNGESVTLYPVGDRKGPKGTAVTVVLRREHGMIRLTANGRDIRVGSATRFWVVSEDVNLIKVFDVPVSVLKEGDGAVQDWLVEYEDQDVVTTVVISRSQLYPSVARPGPAWAWSYDYTVDGGPACQYGTGLVSLRRRLREKYGRDVEVIESWKQQST